MPDKIIEVKLMEFESRIVKSAIDLAVKSMERMAVKPGNSPAVSSAYRDVVAQYGAIRAKFG